MGRADTAPTAAELPPLRRVPSDRAGEGQQQQQQQQQPPRSLKALRAAGAAAAAAQWQCWPLAVGGAAQARRMHLLQGPLRPPRPPPAAATPEAAAGQKGDGSQLDQWWAYCTAPPPRPAAAVRGGTAGPRRTTPRELGATPPQRPIRAGSAGPPPVRAAQPAAPADGGVTSAQPAAPSTPPAAEDDALVAAAVACGAPPSPSTELRMWVLRSQTAHLAAEEGAERKRIVGLESDMHHVWWSREAALLATQGREDAGRFDVEEQEHWARRLVGNLAARHRRVLHLQRQSSNKLILQWWTRLEDRRRQRQRLHQAERSSESLAGMSYSVLRHRFWNRLCTFARTATMSRRMYRNLDDQEYAGRGIIAKEELRDLADIHDAAHLTNLQLWVVRQRIAGLLRMHFYERTHGERQADLALAHMVGACTGVASEEAAARRRLAISSKVLRLLFGTECDHLRWRWGCILREARQTRRRRTQRTQAEILLVRTSGGTRRKYWRVLDAWFAVRRRYRMAERLCSGNDAVVAAPAFRRLRARRDRRVAARAKSLVLLGSTQRGIQRYRYFVLHRFERLRKRRKMQRIGVIDLLERNVVRLAGERWRLWIKYLWWRPKRDIATQLLQRTESGLRRARWESLCGLWARHANRRKRRVALIALEARNCGRLIHRYWRSWDRYLLRRQTLTAKAELLLIRSTRPRIRTVAMHALREHARRSARARRLSIALMRTQCMADLQRRGTGWAALGRRMEGRRRRANLPATAVVLSGRADAALLRMRYLSLEAHRTARLRRRRREELADALAQRNCWTHAERRGFVARWRSWSASRTRRARSVSVVPRLLDSSGLALRKARYWAWLRWLRRRQGWAQKEYFAQVLHAKCRGAIVRRRYSVLFAAAVDPRRRRARALRARVEAQLVRRRWKGLRRWPDLKVRQGAQREQAEVLRRATAATLMHRYYGKLALATEMQLQVF